MYTPIKHEIVNLDCSNPTSGRKRIRKASRVHFADGVIILFVERLSKREAYKQATAAREGDCTFTRHFLVDPNAAKWSI
jgi:hypothetical protein